MLQPMSDLISLAQSTVESLPAAAHILAGVGLLVGLILWLTGRVLLRPAFATLGALAGGAVGFFVTPSAFDALLGVPSPYIGLMAGAAIGLVLGIVLFRFAVAITTGLAVGLAGVLIAAVYLHFAPKPIEPAPESPTISIPTPALDAVRAREQTVELAKSTAETVRTFIAHKAEEVRAAWDEVPDSARFALGVSGVAGAVIGFLLGLLAPKRAAAVATALFGSALILGCGGWLAEALSLPGHQYLDQRAVVWLPVWIGIAVVGFAVQTSGLGKKQKKKPAEE